LNCYFKFKACGAVVVAYQMNVFNVTNAFIFDNSHYHS